MAPETAGKAGFTGPVVAVSRGSAGLAGTVEIGVDVSQLDASFGGDAASRSHLVAIPACALTSPQSAECRQQTPVASHFDPATNRLVADVAVPAASAANLKTTDAAGVSTQSVLLAADTTASGGGGNYAATNLNPSLGWTAGSSSGGFSYSYPIAAPPALGGDTPNVALSYDSSSVDGLTSATNAQASSVGDGWNYTPGYVERSYQPCDNDGLAHSADMCWGGYNATLSLGGQSSELVRDDATSTWRLKNDDGSKVEFLSGASNGTATGEYVKVSTTSGSVYYFGLNHLPGGDKTDTATNSAWSEPVYSPKSTDPFYDPAKGTASWSQMAWRLNLDYAVDPHGNLTTYTYRAESNYYQRGAGQNSGVGTLTSYIRGGALTSITYGQRLSDQVTAKGTLKSADRINFNPAADGRCSTAGGFTCTGATLSTSNATHWPDVPYDQNCASSGACTNYGPSFWSNTRLSSITAQVLSAGAYRNVDTYKLSQSFPDPKDGSKPSMWLDSITRTGLDGGNEPLPAVTFTPVELDNRVDGTNLVPAPVIFRRPRIQQITSETGGQIQVDYSLPACSRIKNVMPASAAADTMACYNVKWYPPGTAYGADPVSDWFNRYQVDSVTQNDPVAHTTAMVTHYTYGAAAWHFDDNELTDPKSRTWNDFRGYATVTAVSGSGTDGPASQTVTTYLQGMDGDQNATGGSKSVSVSDRLGESVTDSDWLSGQALETDTYDKAGGSVTAYTVNRATGPVTTATHIRSAALPTVLPALVARYGATKSVSTSKSLKANGDWQTVTTTTLTDPDHANRTVSVDTVADGQSEQCTRTSYAASSNTLFAGLADEARTVSGAGACTATPTTANTVSDSRTLYDSLAFGQAGPLGNASSVQVLDHYDSSGNPVFVTTATTTYDIYGRVTSATDPNATDPKHPNGATTTTAYTPVNAGELPATVTVTSPAPGSDSNWTTTTTYDIARGLELTNSDLNSKVTTQAYDALGRLTKVWYPGRTASQNADIVYTYAVNGSAAPSAVTTSTLMSDTPVYVADIQIFDGFGRVREVQSTPGISAYHGRVITETLYDSQGRVQETRDARYDDTSAPNATLSVGADDQISGQTVNVYDGQGRTTASIFQSYANEQWRTTTTYPGSDEIDSTPPQGGTPTRTITDSLGRTSQLWQYKTATATGVASDADVTKYTYTPAGNPLTRTDSTTKDVWSYGYDLRGRQITATDPDTGTTKQTYNTDGQLYTTTDARNVTLTYNYDLIGRKTSETSTAGASATSVLQAAWTYDSVAGAAGQPASSTRYVVDSAGTSRPYTTSIGSYDVGYRPTSTTLTLPSTEGGLAGPFTTTAAYNPITGALDGTHTDARGNLPGETVNYSYELYGPLLSYGSTSAEYDLSTDYDAFGRPIRTTVNPWGTEIVATDNYDLATGDLLSSYLDKQTAATGAVQQTTYTRNADGQITALQNIADNTPAQTDLQCFTYDYLGRVTTAWSDTGGITTQAQPKVPNIGGCKNTTPTSGAAAGKTTVGGPAAYWTSYSYDTRGNRTGLTQHDTTGDTTKNVVTTPVFAPAGTQNTPTTATGTGGGTGGAHALLSSTSTGPGNPGSTNYQYDAIGDTTAVTATSGTTNLTWTPEDELATVTATGSTGATSYVYDADGNQLLRRDPGKTTLTFGNDEISLDTSTGSTAGTVTDTRTYGMPNGLTAVRQGSGITWQVADNHGTNTLALDATTLAETRRPVDPFGAPRGTQPTTWAGDHGFVGGTQDPATGLTNLGAREYQPTTGRFLNPDPLLDPGQPQQWNGYAYSNNNPVNLSDPNGTDPPGTQGTCSYDLKFCDAAHCKGVHGVPCGSKAVTTVGTPGNTGGLTVGTNDDGQATLDGVRVPSKQEEIAQHPERWKDSDSQLLLKWIQQDECGGTNAGVPVMEKFCDDAAAGGLLPKAAKDPFGIADLKSCVSKGQDCGSLALDLVSDVLMFAPGVGEIDEAGTAARGAGEAAGAAAKDAETSTLGELENAACSLNSFPGSTPVLTADGTGKPIQDIHVGDTVEATDPLTGETTPEKVTAVIKTLTDTDFTDVTVATPTGPQTLTSTQHHPYWDATRNRWVNATDLHPGDSLRLPDGTTTQAQTIRDYTTHIVTYNLTVANLHTYYVLAGNTPVLVHNDGGDDYNQAMNKALAWLEQRGFKAERPTIGKFGTIQGKPIGTQTSDGKTGFRIEFDERNGAHINVWSGKEKGPHFNFDAAESTVTKIQGRFGCG